MQFKHLILILLILLQTQSKEWMTLELDGMQVLILVQAQAQDQAWLGKQIQSKKLARLIHGRLIKSISSIQLWTNQDSKVQLYMFTMVQQTKYVEQLIVLFIMEVSGI
jgi:hypothetical protein